MEMNRGTKERGDCVSPLHRPFAGAKISRKNAESKPGKVADQESTKQDVTILFTLAMLSG
jgi:hypothetical protein